MTHSTSYTPKVIVSLTSFPKAIPYAVKAIQSVLEGSVLPDKLVLYLVSAEFEEAGLPEELTRLANSHPRFEIRYTDRNLRSYLKLIPALADFPEDIIVTVDDDIHYHRHLLRNLLKLHREVPNAILAHRVRRIAIDKPYRTWKKFHWYNFLFKRIHSDFRNLQTGVGGVLYPPHSLKKEMLDAELFTRLAPSCDDIWFWAAGVANGTPVVPVPFGCSRPRELNKPRSISLMTINYKGGTDRNKAALDAILGNYPQIKNIIQS